MNLLSTIWKLAGIIPLLCTSIVFPTIAQEQTAHAIIRIVDHQTGTPTPVRVRLLDTDGYTTPLPEAAIGIMYGRNDAAEGYGYQPDSAFYVNGGFEITLAPGVYRLYLSKGFEYVTQEHAINLTANATLFKTFEMKRWINMPARGWYSADDHIHIRRSPRENPLILQWLAAEDVHIGAMLQMGDFYTTYFAQYAFGAEGNYREGNYLLTPGQEDPRTHEIGHTILLTADDKVRYRNHYYLYDSVFDRIHELNGLTGYAHQGMSFHGYRGMTLDVLRGKVDFLELLQFCVEGGPLHLDHYYHYLDLGYTLTATAGSDFPWCGLDENAWDAQIGNARFYTFVGDELVFKDWKDGFRKGHTFVTSGPMLEFTVNDSLPGSTILTDNGSSLFIDAMAFGHNTQVPLEKLEIVVQGEVIKTVTLEDEGQSTEEMHLTMKLPVDRGLWIAARCKGGALQWAHTTPVYVHVDQTGHLNTQTAPGYLDKNEEYLQELEEIIQRPHPWFDRRAWTYREALQLRIDEAREIIEEIRRKLDK